MNSIAKISTFEAICFMIVVIINRMLLNTPKEIIKNSATSAWINVIVISIITIVFIIIICKLYKNFSGKDILDISEYLGGNILKTIIGIIFLLLFLYVAAILLRNFCDSLQKIFLPNTTITYIMFFFIVGIILANKLGLPSIIKINIIIIGLIFTSAIIISIAPISYFDFSNLFPIMGNGINETFFSGLTNLFAFSGIGYLYFLMPFLNKPQNFNKIAIVSTVVSSIYLLLSVISLIGLFSYLTTSKDIFSILLLTKVINLGGFLERIDSILMLVWILSFLAYLSFILYFALYTYRRITNLQDQNGVLYLFSTIILGLALLPQNVIKINFLDNELLKILAIPLVFILPLIIFILANMKFKRKSKIQKREV